jgi:hypothetical protein
VPEQVQVQVPQQARVPEQVPQQARVPEQVQVPQQAREPREPGPERVSVLLFRNRQGRALPARR